MPSDSDLKDGFSPSSLFPEVEEVKLRIFLFFSLKKKGGGDSSLSFGVTSTLLLSGGWRSGAFFPSSLSGRRKEDFLERVRRRRKRWSLSPFLSYGEATCLLRGREAALSLLFLPSGEAPLPFSF